MHYKNHSTLTSSQEFFDNYLEECPWAMRSALFLASMLLHGFLLASPFSGLLLRTPPRSLRPPARPSHASYDLPPVRLDDSLLPEAGDSDDEAATTAAATAACAPPPMRTAPT